MAVIPEILWKRGNTLVVNTRSFVLASRDRAVEIETYIEGELLEKKRQGVYCFFEFSDCTLLRRGYESGESNCFCKETGARICYN